MRLRYVLPLLAGWVVALVFLFLFTLFISDNVIADCVGWHPGLPLGDFEHVSCDQPSSPQIQAECVKRGGVMDGSFCRPKNAEVEKCVARHHTWFESLQACRPPSAVVIPTGGLNVRVDVDPNATVAYVVPASSRIELTGETVVVNGVTWWRVYDGNWVQGQYLKFD